MLGWCLLSLLAGADPMPVFQAATLANTSPQGSIERLTGQGELHFRDGKPVAASDWYVLRQNGAVRPGLPKRGHVQFVNGDRLVGHVEKGDGDALHWRTPQGTVLRFPTSALAVVWNQQVPHDELPTWLNGPRSRDLLQLANGDLLRGTIQQLDATDWKIMVEQRQQSVAAKQVVALGYNTDLARPRKIRGLYYRVVLADGSRLSGTTIEADRQKLTLTTLFKETIAWPLHEVREITLEQGKAIPLTELKPQFAYQSFDGEQGTWQMHRALNLQPLTVNTTDGVATYDHGLAVPAGSTLTYSLDGKYQRVELAFGMDAQLGARGSAKVQVTLDGKSITLPNEGLITLKAGLLRVRHDCQGVKELKITLQRASGQGVQSAVNIVDARLLP